jgi:hypothetical protein
MQADIETKFTHTGRKRVKTTLTTRLSTGQQHLTVVIWTIYTFNNEYSDIILAGPPDDLFDADEAFDKVFIQLCDLTLLPPVANVSPERPANSDVWASESMLGFVSDADTGKKNK